MWLTEHLACDHSGVEIVNLEFRCGTGHGFDLRASRNCSDFLIRARWKCRGGRIVASKAKARSENRSENVRANFSNVLARRILLTTSEMSPGSQ